MQNLILNIFFFVAGRK